ncbi:hypothetical protein [Agitococcus lubricus]|nr:hypothetical protein [Agitococcus lubricus]
MADNLSSVDSPYPTATVPPTTHNSISPEPTDCIHRDAEGRFLGWVDSQHCLLSNRTTMTAQWFDSLFGHWHEPNEAKIRLRVINDINWIEGEGLSAKLRFRASAVLPNARKRLRLVVSDDEDTLHPERNQLNNPQEPKTSAAIRWIPDTLSRVKYSFDIGVHSTPDIFARVRAQRSWRISDNSVMNFTETLRYGLKEETKSVSQLQIERLLNDKTVFRWGNALQYWQDEPDPVGLRWSEDWSILHRLAQQKTISYGIVVDGVQQPHWQVESDGIFILYRQSFWRHWLYYEIEPHLTRYRDQDWDVVSAIIFRLEANFGN